MVGKTGTSVDAHLAECVAVQLPLRAGHSDMFHCFDGVGRDVLRHRGAANAAGSNSSSSSDGRAAGSVPAPLSVLDSWTQIVRAQRKLLRRGQGRFFLHKSYQHHGFKTKPCVHGPGPTRYIVHAGQYLRQSLKHFSVACRLKLYFSMFLPIPGFKN